MVLSPARIMEVGLGFWPAKVLLSAIELGVFTELGGNSMTGRELQDALQLHPRANPDLFDTLVALRFLHRDGDGPEARIVIPKKRCCSSTDAARISWAAFWKWRILASIDSGVISPKACGPASRKTKSSTPARPCSRSSTAGQNGLSNLWTR